MQLFLKNDIKNIFKVISFYFNNDLMLFERGNINNISK